MCVLLVEDEPLIRDILAEELRDAGFEVCEAASADEAVPLIANPTATFTLLLTDIHMPGHLNGIALGGLMRSRYPDLPIIYMTGRPDILGTRGPLGNRKVLIRKPTTVRSNSK